MIKCVIFATISMAIAASAARPRVFYVDSGAGDDAKMGDTPGHAWASLARVNRAELEPGDTVRFKRGGTWRGTLRPHSGEVGAPVTYTAYGDGEKPLLLGSERRDKPADWVNAGPDLWVTRKPTWTAVGGEVDLRSHIVD